MPGISDIACPFAGRFPTNEADMTRTEIVAWLRQPRTPGARGCNTVNLQKPTEHVARPAPACGAPSRAGSPRSALQARLGSGDRFRRSGVRRDRAVGQRDLLGRIDDTRSVEGRRRHTRNSRQQGCPKQARTDAAVQTFARLRGRMFTVPIVRSIMCVPGM
jgi:hypothetical protein